MTDPSAHASAGATPGTSQPLRALFVVGSAGSGAGVLSGLLQRLGMHVPQPQAPADPFGSARSRWVVRRHERLLRRANVAVDDARPHAWLATAEAGYDDATRAEVQDWLATACTPERPEVVLEDPGLGWFLGLWRTAALRTGVTASFAVVLRPPAEVLALEDTDPADVPGPTARAAGWVNHMLHVERATRGEPRVFLHLGDLLEDWTVPTHELGRRLDLSTIHNASVKGILGVHDFIEAELLRKAAVPALDLPVPLDELVEETWTQLCRLAEHDTPDVHGRLDELREQYADLYRHAEELTASTTAATRREATRTSKAARPAPDPDDGPTAAVGNTRRRRPGWNRRAR